MAAIPDNAPKPKDRARKKSPDARKAEVDGFIDIEQCGVPLHIPLGENAVPYTHLTLPTIYPV